MAKVHNILADGTEVESLKGHKINYDDFPEVKQIFINLAKKKIRQEKNGA